jgi:anaerobic magnesium-protoporphyrin IX monomethyl ester cyclase
MVTASPQTMIRRDPSTPLFSSHPLRPPLKYTAGDSLLVSESGRRHRANGELPRVLLFVPPYTRLVEPSLPDSAFRQIGIETFEVMKRAGTPIGLLRIGTNASRAGYQVKIVDAPFAGWMNEAPLVQLPVGHLVRYGLTDQELVSIIEEFQPDIVGIQCNYTVQWGNARALADLVKTMDPSIVLLSGGAHSSGDWANALVDSAFDVIVVNESDHAFVEVLDALTMADGSVDHVRGATYRRNGLPVHVSFAAGAPLKSSYMSLNPKRQSLETRLELMPLPDFGLIDTTLYHQPYHSSGARARLGGAWAQVFSTIGCNVGCDFCYIPMINGPWRALGVDWFDLHLADLKRNGVTEILLEDDHLMHDPLYALEVFKLLRKHDLPWVEEGGLSLFNLIMLHQGMGFTEMLSEEEQKSPIFRNVIDAIRQGITARQFIQEMADSGCYNVYLAVESANEESLGNSNKPRINAVQRATAEIVSLFAQFGIQVTGGFMLGFVNPPAKPGDAPYVETLAQIQRTIDYATKLMGAGMAYANPFIVTPIPGTRMWEFQRDYVVRDYDTGWSHEKATMASNSWSAEDIERMRLKLLVDANGPERVREMLTRSTWPVDYKRG